MVAGRSSKCPGPSKVAISGEGRGSKRLITDTRDNVLISSATAVMSNADLLTEILLLLPAISLFLYKTVSKQWLSVITSPTFTARVRQKPNVDPPSSLFVRAPKRQSRSKTIYDFISFDIRVPSENSIAFTFGSKAPAKILQSCNGLLFCFITPDKFYVYNPCVNLFKKLPRPQISVRPLLVNGGMRLVFDPTKSPHYKVVHAGVETDDGLDAPDGGYNYIQIETYSSETGKWSVCVNRFTSLQRFIGFDAGIYSNGALHWLSFDGRYWHVKLDILVDHPVLTIIQLPVKLDGELFRDLKFFESRGCLLLVCKDNPNSRQLNIFEMRNGYSEWSLKYLVNLDDTMMPLPKEWTIRSRFWCIALGEREEDSFMVINSIGKVLQYKIVLKTVRTLFDFGSIGTHEAFRSLHLLLVCNSNSGFEHHEGTYTRGK